MMRVFFCRQQLFNIIRNIQRRLFHIIESHRHSLMVHQVFEEIPFDFFVRHGPMELSIDRVFGKRRYSHNGKGHLRKFAFHKVLNIFIVFILLMKIVGWKGQHLKPLWTVRFLERCHLLVRYLGVTSFGGHVDDETDLAGVFFQ